MRLETLETAPRRGQPTLGPPVSSARQRVNRLFGWPKCPISSDSAHTSAASRRTSQHGSSSSAIAWREPPLSRLQQRQVGRCLSLKTGFTPGAILTRRPAAADGWDRVPRFGRRPERHSPPPNNAAGRHRPPTAAAAGSRSVSSPLRTGTASFASTPSFPKRLKVRFSEMGFREQTRHGSSAHRRRRRKRPTSDRSASFDCVVFSAAKSAEELGSVRAQSRGRQAESTSQGRYPDCKLTFSSWKTPK